MSPYKYVDLKAYNNVEVEMKVYYQPSTLYDVALMLACLVYLCGLFVCVTWHDKGWSEVVKTLRGLGGGRGAASGKRKSY